MKTWKSYVPADNYKIVSYFCIILFFTFVRDSYFYCKLGKYRLSKRDYDGLLSVKNGMFFCFFFNFPNRRWIYTNAFPTSRLYITYTARVYCMFILRNFFYLIMYNVILWCKIFFVYSQHLGLYFFLFCHFVSHGRVCTCSLVYHWLYNTKVAKRRNHKKQ
jgi:hypothetical protein